MTLSISEDVTLTPSIVFMFTTIALSSICLIVLLCLIARRLASSSASSSSFFSASFSIPEQYSYDEESLVVQAENLSPKDKLIYQKLISYQSSNPPVFRPLGQSYDDTTILIVKERGINAFQFENTQDDFLSSPRFIIEDRTDINFINNDDGEVSTSILNYALPTKNRNVDTIYFETKLFEFSPENHVSIGLVTKPYPLFCLPGYSNFSVAVESNGNLRINSPYPTPKNIILPNFQQSDVVGIGYRYRLGAIFVTHNGHKVMDIAKHIKLDLYPAIGSIGNCKVQVNLGQSGFVHIEANVKKWGFVTNSTLMNGNIGAPPIYDKSTIKNGDKILEQGDQIPPDYPANEETFFGPPIGSNSANPPIIQQFQQQVEQAGRFSKSKTPESDPPSYPGSSSSQNESTPLIDKNNVDNYDSTKLVDHALSSDEFVSSQRVAILQDTIPEGTEDPTVSSAEEEPAVEVHAPEPVEEEEPTESEAVEISEQTETIEPFDSSEAPDTTEVVEPTQIEEENESNNSKPVEEANPVLPVESVLPEGPHPISIPRESFESVHSTTPLGSSSTSKNGLKSTAASFAAQFRQSFSRSNSALSIPALVQQQTEDENSNGVTSTPDDTRSISTALSRLARRNLKKTPLKKKKASKKKKKAGKRAW